MSILSSAQSIATAAAVAAAEAAARDLIQNGAQRYTNGVRNMYRRWWSDGSDSWGSGSTRRSSSASSVSSRRSSLRSRAFSVSSGSSAGWDRFNSRGFRPTYAYGGGRARYSSGYSRSYYQ